MLLVIIFLLTHTVIFLKNFQFKAGQKFVVAASVVRKKNLDVILQASGIAQPINTIMVKSQIDGTILTANFQEGQMVTKDQLLFEIDPAPLQALYNQAVATLARDEADLNNKILQLQKSEKLYRNKFVSEQDYQQAQANFAVAKSTVQASKSAADAAKLQLGFTKIHAPINGIVGQTLVNPGNVIKAAAGTNLVSINQISPINIIFAIPENYLNEIVKNINNLEHLPVKVQVENRPCKERTGKLIFINNQVNSLNGMITLKAEFCNCDLAFWPGQFINVALTVKTIPDTLVVSSRAVQIGQAGPYVYIAEKTKVNKNNYFAKVKKVSVKIGVMNKEEIQVIEGLAVGQMVITEGHTHLTNDQIVEIYAN